MGNPDQPTPPHIVDKLRETVGRGDTHRYSQSKGIPRLRKAICDWYQSRYNVELDADAEAIVTLGSKEGLAHLALATTGVGDAILVPNPSYPIHPYGFVISGADLRHVPMRSEAGFLEELEVAIRNTYPKPKMLVLNFPSNPTGHCVELSFFERVVDIARQHGIWVVHDLAYADLVFDGYTAPSILQVPGAREIAVEFFTFYKSFNMPGWRVVFFCGNSELIAALTRIKSYRLRHFRQCRSPQSQHRGRSTMCARCAICTVGVATYCVRASMRRAGPVEPPKATMFVWAEIPEPFRPWARLSSASCYCSAVGYAVSPGVGFGEYGEDSCALV